MNKQKVQKTAVVIVTALALVSMFGQTVPVNASGSGLKVNLSASSNTDGTGHYCVHGGGETVCKNAEVPGEVQIQFGKGVVENGDSIRGCVEFRGHQFGGQTKCDSGFNSDAKAPENLHVSFTSGNNNDNDNDGGSASASSSGSASSSSSSSSSSSLCLFFCGDGQQNEDNNLDNNDDGDN
jgi:hypothetical protein